MEFYIGGYYLIEGAPIKDWMNHDLLPAQILTPSSCICDLHPDDICLSWVKGDKKTKNAYREKLGITKEEFTELQKEVDELFNSEKYGWLQVFLEVEQARNYYQKWLTKIPNIKLVAIATTKKHKEIFLAEEKQEGDNAGFYGTWLSLRNNIPIDLNQGLLGYEVLGFEMGGFHSFICNSLENDFSKKLGIKFNDNGLISSFNDADKAADYAQNPDVGAEPALWQPWAIVELSKNG
jgi:hypothetical protein